MSDIELDAVQQKLFALARSARARIEAAEGAAVVDETGRTYSAASVSLAHTALSAVQLAVATAAGAGAAALHGAVVVRPDPVLPEADRRVLADLALPGAAVVCCRPDGAGANLWSVA